MSMTKEIIGAFDPEIPAVFCLDCYNKLEEDLPFITPDDTYFAVDTEAYPDGFTCEGCLEVVLPSNYQGESGK